MSEDLVNLAQRWPARDPAHYAGSGPKRDAALAEVERLTNELNAHSEVNRRLILERDVAEAEVDRLNYQVAAMIGVAELAEAAAAKEEAETDRVVGDGNRWLAEVERLTAERDAAEAEVERQTIELNNMREKATRVQYDEFPQITAKVIDKHQRERDHALQQAYRLQQAGANRPTDEDIWREAFMAAMERGGVFDRTKVADLALAEYRRRWPR